MPQTIESVMAGWFGGQAGTTEPSKSSPRISTEQTCGPDSSNSHTSHNDTTDITTPTTIVNSDTNNGNNSGSCSGGNSCTVSNTLSKECNEEISRDQALVILLRDESFHDCHLKGTDGVVIGCNRSILCARSPTLRRLLAPETCGGAAKSMASSKRHACIPLAYPGDVIQAVVDYIHTDQCRLFKRQQRRIMEDNHDFTVSTRIASTVLALTDAALGLALPGLYRKTKDWARSIMFDQPEMACLFLTESNNQKNTVVEDLARQIIRTNPAALLEEHGGRAIALLNAALLESILSDKEMEGDDFTLFRILQAWTVMERDDESVDADKESTSKDITVARFMNWRMTIASQLVKYIHLERINPTELSTVVASSGLVNPDQLLQAYRTQAMVAEQTHGVQYCIHRSVQQPVWESTNDATLTGKAQGRAVETLKCRPINDGIHEWSIKIVEGCSFMLLGVISSSVERHSKSSAWLGGHEGDYAYANNGTIYQFPSPAGQVKQTYPKYGKGSKVTFHLNCTKKEGGGTLSVSVDDGPWLVLFTSMLTIPNQGFLPAASLIGGQGCIQLLTLRDLSLRPV